MLVTWIDCDWQDAQANLIGWIYERLQEQVRGEGSLPINWQRVEAQPSDSRRIWQLARDLKEQGIRLVLLLDNFDRVFESQLISADAMDELRPLTFEMALLVATEQPLHDLDRELAASPLFNVMTQLFLGLLEPNVAREWVLSYADEFPIVAELADDLVALTGQHPFLLRRLGEILIEVRQMLPPDAGDGALLLPLLRLRLAEHGRLLFETIWRRLQNLPAAPAARSRASADAPAGTRRAAAGGCVHGTDVGAQLADQPGRRHLLQYAGAKRLPVVYTRSSPSSWCAGSSKASAQPPKKQLQRLTLHRRLPAMAAACARRRSRPVHQD